MVNDDPDFVKTWNEAWSSVKADIALTIGIEPISASDSHVELAMAFRPEIAQVTGVLSAGALIQLADVTATALCRRTIQERDDADSFPFSVQMNAHLIANTGSGRAIARSRLLSAGQTVMTAETVVRDEQGKDLMLLTSTHIVKRFLIGTRI
jgi:uncharacterized protein (TIGR00369 family)